MIQDKPEVLFAATSSGRGGGGLASAVQKRNGKRSCSCIRTNSNNVLVRELADLRWGGCCNIAGKVS